MQLSFHLGFNLFPLGILSLWYKLLLKKNSNSLCSGNPRARIEKDVEKKKKQTNPETKRETVSWSYMFTVLSDPGGGGGNKTKQKTQILLLCILQVCASFFLIV